MRLLTFHIVAMWSVCLAYFCCFPKQWEGTLSTWSQDYPAGGLYFQVNGDISVDMIGQRVREYYPPDFLELSFFKEGVRYTIRNNSRCYKGSVSPWPSSKVCVPEDAKFLRKYQVGIQEKMKVTDYMFTTNSSCVKQTVRTVTDTSMCQPVEDKIVIKCPNTGVTDVYTMTYENITPGIKDPSVFDVPSFCKSTGRKKSDA